MWSPPGGRDERWPLNPACVEADSGRELATLHGRAVMVTACAVTPDGRRVVSALEATEATIIAGDRTGPSGS